MMSERFSPCLLDCKKFYDKDSVKAILSPYRIIERKGDGEDRYGCRETREKKEKNL